MERLEKTRTDCRDPFKRATNVIKEAWKYWINEVIVNGFNCPKHDLSLIKQYFVKSK